MIQSAFIMIKFTIHAMKHCSYIVLTCIKYIRKNQQRTSYSRINHCSNIEKETRAKIVCEQYEIVSRKVNFAESSDDDKNDGHTEEDPDYIDHEVNRTVLSDSATLLGLSPIEVVGKQDRAGYVKPKVKTFKNVLWHLLVTLTRMNYYTIIHQNVPNVLTQID